MDTTYEAHYHQLEENHWWFAARRNIVFNLIRQYAPSPDTAILEIGCSGGPLLLDLRAAGYSNLTGIDVSETGIALARRRGLDSVQVMDGAKLDFPDASFDLLIASDVLEHIEDEDQAVREWLRVLRPGGQLIVFVPAFQFLWSQHDEVNHHYRRYSAKRLRATLERGRFAIERTSYWNSTLFLPVAAMRLLQSVLPKKKAAPSGDLQVIPGGLNKALLTLLRTENRMLRFMDLPVGVSTFIVAKRPAA
ncbi:class I SAM-dependent methyltransferase [Hymenobacter busanensis]|uniref:Class I SAM-dependent methyltransferase n=1 Tax=Hymenobacter busanensis TaxID=2607656 RepID=A0A7L4ZYC1_9BACT|nr:class I SAM-dependent methyltransferase [Hymenobacter busanensis]KAA9331346.1 class I SAM-dependent methyltransferase [Hymenobacter busanensis]QHJ08499.1 methyltransferase domain-containing protein [Hymenobacter busanensis]